MKKEKNIYEKFVNAFKGETVGKEFTTKEIREVMCKKYDIAESSVLPSDACYNSSNKGVDGLIRPRIFKKICRGKYEYVGEDFDASNVNEHEFGT